MWLFCVGAGPSILRPARWGHWQAAHCLNVYESAQASRVQVWGTVEGQVALRHTVWRRFWAQLTPFSSLPVFLYTVHKMCKYWLIAIIYVSNDCICIDCMLSSDFPFTISVRNEHEWRKYSFMWGLFRQDEE